MTFPQRWSAIVTSVKPLLLSYSGQAIVSHAPSGPEHEFYTIFCYESNKSKVHLGDQ